MKFLCLDCDEPMKLLATEGPEDGSLAVTFRCPECGFRVAMLTNQFETQMVKSLGVKVGGRTEPAQPFEHLRASMAQAPDIGGAERDAAEPEAAAPGGPGCPFAAMLATLPDDHRGGDGRGPHGVGNVGGPGSGRGAPTGPARVEPTGRARR